MQTNRLFQGIIHLHIRTQLSIISISTISTISRVLAGQESIISRENGFGAIVRGYTDKRTMLLTQGVTVTPSDLTQTIVNETFNSLFLQAEL